MKKQRFMEASYLTCPVCGNKTPISRCKGRRREYGHIKDMYCWYCKEERKFVEHAEYLD